MTREPGPDRATGPDATDGSGPDAAPDAVGGALDVIDRSIGMYVVRRLTGRRTSKPEEPAPPVVLTADQVAYRIGAVGATRAAPANPADPSEPGAPLVAGTAAAAAAGRAAATHPVIGVPSQTTAAGPRSASTPVGRPTRGPRAGAGAPRERLVRDSGIALLALATIGLVAVVLWPHGPTGQPEQSVFGVNRTVATPGPTGEVDAATAQPVAGASAESETATPTSDATAPIISRATAAIAQPTPKLPPGATPRPTPKRTPTPGPTTASTPTATAAATPTATVEPTPPPTPDQTPPPTPEPTPPPTPVETPTPTPDPTP